MANTRQATKRAKQAKARQARNQIVKSATRTALKAALESVQSKSSQAKECYIAAVKALSKAASKGSIPKGRAARKISRLTHLVKKVAPQVLS